MESIHSYEQRSSSEIYHEPDSKQNRVIIVDRRDPNGYWSTCNQPVKSRSWLPSILKQRPRNEADRPKRPSDSSTLVWSPSHLDSGPFPSNDWCTSKYTRLSFLPKNLFEQFRRFANFYFLTTAILQLITPLSPVGPTTSLLPLIFVVATTSIKQAYEDYLRHKLDKEVNNRMCQVMRNKRLVKTRSKDIRVGDFVYVKNNEEIPCDMILLASSGYGDRCYITTANLDGETSLKCRTCFHIKEQLGDIHHLDEMLLVVECERPNATLYEFNGFVRAPKSLQSYNLIVGDLRSKQIDGQKRTGSEGQSSSPYSRIVDVIMRRIRLGSKATKKSQVHHIDANILNNAAEFHEIPLDISNLLIRASRLRNTGHIIGLAVYTGRDTKLALNSHMKPNKFSSTEQKINTFLMIAFLILITLSIVGALLYHRPKSWYAQGLDLRDSFAELLIAHFLIYNYMVPISLYVTLEFVKFFGTKSVVDDKKMQVTAWRTVYNTTSGMAAETTDHSDTLRTMASSNKINVREGTKCNSSDLNEELGQVEVLFSDKTGTLTENKMLFMACSIHGQLHRSIGDRIYRQPDELFQGNIPDQVSKLATIKSGRHAFLSPSNNDDFHGESDQRAYDHRVVPPLDKLEVIENVDTLPDVVDFFICLCLCSTITLNETSPLADCLPSKTGNEYDFQSASPDEESLISAAHQYGITMCKSNDRECFIVINKSSSSGTKLGPASGKNYKPLVQTKNSTDAYVVRHFQRLQVFEFNSTRKRMSVLYRDCDNDCNLIVTKGSEEMLDCVSFEDLNEGNRRSMNHVLAHSDAFAKSGLRTLLVARRVVSQQEYEKIVADIKEAHLSIQHRDYLLNSVYKRSETHLKLIGCTAVEDTLQEHVPETIAHLREAGIKVWLLTGDRVETAISVAYLCKLLDSEMKLFHLVRVQDSPSCQKLLHSFGQQVKSHRSKDRHHETPIGKQHSITSRSSSFQPKYALIADGRSLYYAMKHSKSELSELCKSCTSVLGCRLSPLQKAEIVSMIKGSESKPITAAIGDGANDVAMIQEAHVGIGVNGKEGRQAVNSSDFAICRFYMLNRLLFVHGHLFYNRTANTIHYFFYKNLLFILPQFLYSFYNLSSAKSLYHPVMLISFNLFFTSLPVIVYGLYELHIPEPLLENHPKLYQFNRGNSLMSMSVFAGWLAMASIQSIVTFFTIKFIWGSHTPLLESGKMGGINGFSLLLYFVIVIIASLNLYLLSNNHTICFNLSTISSVILLPVFLYCYSLVNWSFAFEDNSLYGQVIMYLSSPMFWMAIISTTLAAIVPNVIWYVRNRVMYFRRLNSIIRIVDMT